MAHINNFKRAISLVYNGAPLLTAINMALRVTQGVLPLFLLYLTKLFIDAISDGVAKGGGAASSNRVGFIIAAMALVTLIQALCRSSAEIVTEAQSQAVTDKVIDIVHAKSVEVDLEFYENPGYYDSLHIVQTQIPSRVVSMVNGLAGLAQNAISLFAMAGLLFSFNWAVAAILFIAVIPGALMRIAYSGEMHRWYSERASTTRKANYLNALITGQGHAKEMRLFGLGDLLRRRFRRLRQKLRHEKLRIALRKSFSEAVAQFGAICAIFVSFSYIAYRCLQGTVTVGSLVMYYQAFQRGQGYLKDTLAALTRLHEDSLFISELDGFLKLKNKVIEPAAPRPFPRPMREGIVFDHVNFRYPAGAKNVLEDVSFAVKPGEHIALVGENGAGKTTVIKLLCRLYDPASGRITVDGIDLRQFGIGQLRAEIGALFQDYARYNMTARENIWFGDIRSSPDEDRIEAAARFSGAEGVISDLPRGYKTILGRLFEGGRELSVGEWQKVALARAFLRRSDILVLDEPTSALDARSEHEVFMNFHKLAKGRTVFFISHRLSTVKMADRILMLHDGRIIESGSHEELLDRKSVYADLFEMQARHYREYPTRT